MAAVSQVNLVIPKGVNFEETFFLTAGDGSGLNLTGQTVVAKLKKHPNATTAFSFSTTVTVATGEVKITMSGATTATLPSGRCVYDIVLTSSGGTKSKVVEGTVLVQESVSV